MVLGNPQSSFGVELGPRSIFLPVTTEEYLIRNKKIRRSMLGEAAKNQDATLELKTGSEIVTLIQN